MTVTEAAKALGVSESTVYSLCAHRRIKHYRIGNRAGKIVIDPADLESFRKERLVDVNPTPLPNNHPTPSLKHLRI